MPASGAAITPCGGATTRRAIASLDCDFLGKVPARSRGMTSEPAIELAPGPHVGSYRIVKEIGRGGMGTVYEAAARRAAAPRGDQDHARRAAPAARHGDARWCRRRRSSRTSGTPGIVARVRVQRCCPDHRPWIAMELVEGETLASRLRPARAAGRRRCRRAARRGRRRARAVHARGIVHRDLKPDNLHPHARRSRLSAPRDRLGRRAPRADRPAHPRRPDAGHADLHVAGAGDRPQHRRAVRHLLARRDRVRGADRPPAVRRPHARRGRVRCT